MMGPDWQQLLPLTLTADSNTINKTVECLELMRATSGNQSSYLPLQLRENHSAATD